MVVKMWRMSKKLVLVKIVFWTLILGGCISCVDYVDIEQRQDYVLIERKLQERRSEYIHQKMIQCRLDILDRAESFVDSMIDFEIKLNVLDPSLFPHRPTKPLFPQAIILDDSNVVTPLFNRGHYRFLEEKMPSDSL